MAVTYEYVGKTGGGGKAIDLSPGSPVEQITVTLPDGQWCLLADARNTHSTTAGAVLFNDVEVQGLSGTARGGNRASAMQRHLSGSVAISTTGNTGAVTVNSIIAFPDPE